MNLAIQQIRDLLESRRFDEAHRLAAATLLEREKENDAVGAAWAQYYVAEATFELGAYALALDESRPCIERFNKLNVMNGAAWAQCNYARALCMLGRHEEALEALAPALDEFHGEGDGEGEAVARRWRSLAQRSLGRLADAGEELTRSMRAGLAQGKRLRLLECLHDLSWFDLDSGREARALRLQIYVASHPEVPRWCVLNLASSIGRLEKRLGPLEPPTETPESLVGAFLEGRDF